MVEQNAANSTAERERERERQQKFDEGHAAAAYDTATSGGECRRERKDKSERES